MFDHQELVQEINGLKRFANKLTRNSSDADDLLQLTLLKSLEHGESFQNGSNLFGWTSRILFNTFVSQYRHRVQFDTQFDSQVYIDREMVDANQESIVELNQVLKAMDYLSDDHREIITLICIDGLQYAEVANILDIPVGTVRSRLSRARLALQDILQIENSVNAATPHDAYLVA